MEKLKQSKRERMKTILDSVVKKKASLISHVVCLSLFDLLQICQSLDPSILWQVTLSHYYWLNSICVFIYKICIYHIFSIRLSVSGFLGCSHGLAIANGSAMNSEGFSDGASSEEPACQFRRHKRWELSS